MNNLMRRSGIVAVLCLVLCLCLLICSCKGNGGDKETDPEETPAETPVETPNESEPDESEPDESEPVVENVTYTVTVKNAAGEGIANVDVQLCSTICTPGKTDASGVATFTLAEATYTAKITAAVEGYTVDTTKEYSFAEGETALVIVLEAAPAVVDNKIYLKDMEPEYDFIEIAPGRAEFVYGYTYLLLNEDAEDYDDLIVSVKKGDSAVYVFEATGDGYIVVEAMEGLGVKFTVKNVTTGTAFEPLSGIGVLMIPTVAGNTYEITAEYTQDEEAFYVVSGVMTPDGSKDAPYYLYEGLVETEVVIPEGETVWFYLEDYNLLIENPTVKVIVESTGTIYAPNAQGVIDMSVLEYPYGLIGISSSVADAKVEIKLTGSSADAPLSIYDLEMLEIISFEGKTVYCAVGTTSANDIITITANGGEVEVTDLFSRTSGFVPAVDTNDSDAVAVVDASGYNSLYFIVEGATDLDITVSVPLGPEGSEGNPFVIEELGTIEISKQTIDELTVTGVNPRTGEPYSACFIYYIYTATEECEIVASTTQVEPGVSYICPMSIEAIDGSWSYEWEMHDTLPGAQVITLNPGDTVFFYIEVSAEQLASTEGMTLTFAAE